MEQFSIWRPDWKTEEIQVLRELFCQVAKEEILSRLPRRTWSGISHKAAYLKIRRRRHGTLEEVPKLKLSEVQKTWLACAIDAEGAVGLSAIPQKRANKQKVRVYKPHVQVGNTYFQFIEHFKELLYKRLKIIELDHSGKNQKNVYLYSIFSMPEVYSVLKTISPYLIIKKKQAELVLKWIELEDERMRRTYFGDPLQYSDEQKEIWKALMVLNHRGRISIMSYQRANELFKKTYKVSM